MRAARIRLDEVFRLGDIPKIVGVRVRELRKVHARTDGAFDHLKAKPVIEGAEDADDAVRLLVDMGGDGDAAEPLYKDGDLFDRDAGRDESASQEEICPVSATFSLLKEYSAFTFAISVS